MQPRLMLTGDNIRRSLGHSGIISGCAQEL